MGGSINKPFGFGQPSSMAYDLASSMATTDEDRFQEWIRALPWFSEFKEQYGQEPNLNDPDYDYRKAYNSGITPERYKYDNNRYHWPSNAPDGSPLKSRDHPTKWMEDYMRATGRDPNADGVTEKQWNVMKNYR